MLLRSFLCCIALSVTICGCGGGGGVTLVDVSGTVNYGGKPVAGATVTMTSEKGELSTGFTDASGKFKMTTGGRPGVPVGPKKVGITKAAAAATQVDPQAVKPEDMRKMQMAGGGTATDLTPKSEIPIKYADPAKSGLVATVDADASKNVFEYPLVD